MKRRQGKASRRGVERNRKPRRTGTPEVHKFGGASLADGAAVARAVRIIAAREGPQVVVVSAMAGVTDALLELARGAAAGDSVKPQAAAHALRDKYVAAARAVLPAGPRRDEVVGEIEGSLAEVQQLASGLATLQELTSRTTDYLVARGERLSARLMAAALEESGRKATYVDALAVVQTDGVFGQASPDLRRTERAARATLRPLLRRGIIPVVPGFIGAGRDGEVVTLGRGGSDLTATLLGRALGAREVSLWKDVPGLLTADPRLVPDARVVPQLHVREAAELAYYGAKVLHPRALIPVSRRAIAVRVRPFADPALLGTEISRRRTLSGYPVKALSAIPGQALVTVTGSGMLGVPGIAARTFGAMHRAGISVSLISQASSEHSICFSVPEGDADRARAALLETFHDEIAREEIDGVELRRGAATVVVVGLGMYGTPGIAARIFGALADARINVIAIAQGSSELNVSAVVDAKQTAAALRAIHAAFQLAKIGGGAMDHAERTDVVLLGFGQIGRTLAPLLTRGRRDGPPLRVVGVIDRSGFVFDAGGLSARRLAALAAGKQRNRPLARTTGGHKGSAADAVAFAARHALSNPILVDITADDTTATLQTALGAGMHVVLANKRPVAADKALYDALLAAARRAGRELRLEATVGAGLPIIDTYDKLVESGDSVSRIEGCPSGTLGYLFGELGRGKTFSAALRGAIDKGYPEPDPREDLSGMDVARKALILGRLLGFPGEMKDIKVESLVPAGAERLETKDFLARLEDYDAAWHERVEAARAKGNVLRYRAIITRRSVRVGLVEVPAASPLGSLDGTDNRFIFTTKRYHKNPLVITGPGAGPAVTAGGIFNDVLRLAGA
jgi:aspartokinase/homoserine dehydrogenase 1